MKTIRILALMLISVGSAQAMEPEAKRAHNLVPGKLWRAARRGDAVQVKELIALGYDVNEDRLERYIDSPLAMAAMSGNKETVELLIKAGADLYWRDGESWNNSVLSFADRCMPICELIVEKMLSNPDEEQKNQLYAVMYCFSKICFVERANLRNLFKPYLRAMIKEENAPKVHAEIQALGFDEPKKQLLEKYFPEQPVLQGNMPAIAYLA